MVRVTYRMPILRLLLVLFALTPVAALAQAQSCRIPDIVPRPAMQGPSPDDPPRLMPITGYTLALSWSPEYCRTRQSSTRDRIQCGGGQRFGFVLHGLWPDGSRGSWPQYCRASGIVPDRVVRATLCATPSVQLIQHEWEKHGTCAAADPARYFRAATGLYRAVRYPDMDALSRRSLTAAQFAAAFAAVNPGLRAPMIRLSLNRRGWLEEIWLCLGTDLRPRACPPYAEAAKPGAPVRIWRGR